MFLKRFIIVVFISIIMLILYVFNLNAQSTALDSLIDEFLYVNVDSLLDEIVFEEGDINLELKPQNNFRFLYWRTNYDNKTFYAGREIGIDQYNLSGQMYYFNSKGFVIGAAGSWYSQIDPKYSSTVVTAGYSKGLKNNKNFRYRTSYNRYFYNNNDPSYEATYNSSLNLGATIKKKWAGTRINYTLLMGQEYGNNISWDLYSKINLVKLGKYDKIQFEPEIGFSFSSETVENDNYDYLTDYLTSNNTSEKFGLLNTQLRLPVSINYKNFDFEVGYTYNIPRSLDANYNYENTSFINFSLGYIISFIN